MTLQHTSNTATHRNTLQHTATHCNTLQILTRIGDAKISREHSLELLVFALKQQNKLRGLAFCGA